MTTQDIHDIHDDNLHEAPKQPQTADTPQPDAAPQQPKDKENGRYCTRAVISIIVAAIAWIIAGWNGYIALAAGAVSIVCGIMALKSHRHSVRNTAITAIIASAVLVVVLAAFIIVIYLGLNAI